MPQATFESVGEFQQHMYKLGEYQALVDLGVISPGDREKEANVLKTLKGFMPGSAQRVKNLTQSVTPARSLRPDAGEQIAGNFLGTGAIAKAAPKITKQAPATAAQLTPQSSRLQQALARNRRGQTYQTGQQAGDAAFAGRLQQQQQKATSLLTPPVRQPAAAAAPAAKAAPTQTAATQTAATQTAATAPVAAPAPLEAAAAPGSWMPQRWQDARFALQQQPAAGSLGARGAEDWAQAARLMKPELYAAGGAGLLGTGALVGRATAPEPTVSNMLFG